LLIAGHEKVIMTDGDRVAEFKEWLDEHAARRVR
jgi:hypothetical protein